jgi:hypothetical protein
VLEILNSGLVSQQFDRVECLGLYMSQTIPAHFDGQHILLDEAIELEPNTRLLVTVLPKDADIDAWRALSAKRLEGAYAQEEEEYPLDLIKEPNTE